MITFNEEIILNQTDCFYTRGCGGFSDRPFRHAGCGTVFILTESSHTVECGKFMTDRFDTGAARKFIISGRIRLHCGLHEIIDIICLIQGLRDICDKSW